jgi:hypothetical protein
METLAFLQNPVRVLTFEERSRIGLDRGLENVQLMPICFDVPRIQQLPDGSVEAVGVNVEPRGVLEDDLASAGLEIPAAFTAWFACQDLTEPPQGCIECGTRSLGIEMPPEFVSQPLATMDPTGEREEIAGKDPTGRPEVISDTLSVKSNRKNTKHAN